MPHFLVSSVPQRVLRSHQRPPSGGYPGGGNSFPSADFRGPFLSMLRRIARILLVAILMFSIGLHWIVLQSAAWAGMLIDFAREGSVIEAVEKTFDGQHACPQCKKVKEGSQDSKRKQSPQENDAVKDMDAVLVNEMVRHPDLEGKAMTSRFGI